MGDATGDILEQADKRRRMSENKEKNTKELLTTFGLIPQMPEHLSRSNACIIAVLPKFKHQLELRSICMLHQLYAEKLEKLSKEGVVYIFPTSKCCTVKKDGKRVWIK